MSSTKPDNEASTNKIHWPSVLQLLLSAGSIGLLLLLGLIVAGSVVVNLIAEEQSLFELTGSTMVVGGMVFAAALLSPSAYFAFLRVTNRPIQRGRLSNFLARVAAKPLLWLLPILALGTLFSQNELIALIFLPPFHALGAGFVVFWLMVIASRKLGFASQQRNWGVLAAGLVLGPFLGIAMEIIAGIFIFLVGLVFIASQPEYLAIFERLNNLDLTSISETQILTILEPLLSNPLVLVLVLSFFGLAVPLIEELIKPIGVWLSLGKEMKASTGFVLGALSGAGFALFENLTLAAGAEDWITIITARIGTTSMHLLTAGITGWALVRARNEKRYWQLFGAYLLSVGLHGLWNSLVVLTVVSGLELEISYFSFSEAWSTAFVIGLLLLAISSIFLLGFINRKFRAQALQS